MRRSVALGICVVIVSACQDQQVPTTPTTTTEPPLFEISDGAHCVGGELGLDGTCRAGEFGNPHFYFLAPIGFIPFLDEPPTITGVFNAEVNPRIEICRLNNVMSDCDPTIPLVAEANLDGGTGGLSAVYLLDRSGELGEIINHFIDLDFSYAALWKTGTLQAGRKYRISILVGSTVLGFADLDVATAKRELLRKLKDRDEFVPLLNNSILPITFWIGQSALACPDPSDQECAGNSVEVDLSPEAFPAGAKETIELFVGPPEARVKAGAFTLRGGQQNLLGPPEPGAHRATQQNAQDEPSTEVVFTISTCPEGRLEGEHGLILVGTICIRVTTDPALEEVLQAFDPADPDNPENGLNPLATVTMCEIVDTEEFEHVAVWRQDEETGDVFELEHTHDEDDCPEVVVGEGPARAPGVHALPKPAGDSPWTSLYQAAVEAEPLASGFIAFHSNRDDNFEIYRMNPDGSGQTRLTNDPLVDSSPDVSPDGTKIAFTRGVGGSAEIYVMNADGSGVTQITFNSVHDDGPVWSPDGAKIAFRSTRDGNFEIYVMNADGSNQARLTNNPASDFYYDWAPDGSMIVFSSDRSESQQLYSMKSDGTGVIQLTNSGANTSPRWSPDGASIMFTKFIEGNSDIYVMQSDGSDVTRLTTDPAFDGEGDWSPEGTHMVFTSARDGNFEIYVMHADGSEQTRLTSNVALDREPTWGGTP